MKTEKKKIAIITGSLVTGGAEAMVSQLVVNIDRSKYDVILICTYKSVDSPIEKFLKKNNIPITFLNKEGGLDFNAFSTLLKLNKILYNYNPDIVHSHLHGAIYVIPFILLHRSKLVHTLHTLPEKEFSRVIQYILKFYYVIGKGVLVTVSPQNQKETMKYYNLSESKVKMIYNPVEVSKYYRKIHRENEFVLVNVGRQDKNKNQQLIISAFEKINSRYKNLNLRLILVGDGECNNDLQNLARTYKLEKKIIFTGIVSNIEDFLAEADVFILSSKYEGLPLSILEAMAAGLPIISTDVGGIKDIVTNNGILINEGSIEELVEAMQNLIENPKMREQFSNNSSKNVQIFNSKNMAIEYCKIYNEMSK